MTEGSCLLFVISKHRRISRSIKGGITIVAASAYTNATGNGKRFFAVDIHQAHLCRRINAKVVAVGIHKTIVLINPRLIKCTVEIKKSRCH